MKDELVYIRHILDEIVFLRKISKDRTFDDLIHDDYFAHAVRSAVEVIGEAAKNVPDSISNIRISPGGTWGHSGTRSSTDISG